MGKLRERNINSKAVGIALKKVFDDSSQARQEKTVLLQDWEDLPLWQKELDTKYIRSGYRPTPESLYQCLQSWNYLHNESINIWSHVLGALLFMTLPVYLFSAGNTRLVHADRADILVHSIYYLGVAGCFILSAAFHTSYHYSPHAARVGVQLDFLGVILLMWSATIPLVYYDLYCFPKLQVAYWAMLSIQAVACGTFTFQSHFSHPLLRHLRASTFASLAASTLVPVVHSIYLTSFTHHVQNLGLYWILSTLVLNGLAAVFYISKWPEKCWEKRFDIVGCSHQWLHVLVVAASGTFAVAVVRGFDWVHGGVGVCS